MLLLCAWTTATAADLPDPSDLPPAGYSRFDLLVGAGPIPFPLTALMARVDRELERSADGFAPIKTTLIPLGRSLQRMAGAPDFFRFPRVVAGVDGHQRAGFAPLRDRLYFGYNERGGVLEIISYNEIAGRFEFQVVREYRAGATPQLFYARRALCTACHQNQAPIFSRPLWDETTANPQIAARLAATARDHYGLAPTGTDIAYLLDISVERAGLFPLWQQIWREGCSAECRREWLDAALRYALAGVLPDPPPPLPAMAAQWRSQWPLGLPVPSSSLPNRDPLQSPIAPPATAVDAPPLQRLAPMPPQLEPLTRRPPREHWTAPDATALITGLAGLLDAQAVAALDRSLAAATGATTQIEMACRFTLKPQRLRYRCGGQDATLAGVIEASGRRGHSDALTLGAARSAGALALAGTGRRGGALELAPASRTGAHTRSVRLSDGRRWTRLELRTGLRHWPRAGAPPVEIDGSGRVTLVDDYAPARATLRELPALRATTFDGGLVLSQILARRGHAAAPPLPVARLEPAAAAALTGAAGHFQRHCGQCHDNAGGFPPNFLTGEGSAVAANLDHCAPRIWYRLQQWRLDAVLRHTTPMPPPATVAATGGEAAWVGSADLAALIDDARHRLDRAGVDVDATLAAAFDALPPCLRDGSAPALSSHLLPH